MVPKKKRTPDEAWDAIERMSVDDEVERVLGMSDEQVDEELGSAGLDPQQVRERGRALAKKLQRERKRQGGAPSGRVVWFRRARWVVLLAASLGAVTLALRGGPELVSRGYRDDERAHREKAAEWRAKASSECPAARWRACLDDLNAARALDPTIEEDETARQWRIAAESALTPGDAGR